MTIFPITNCFDLAESLVNLDEAEKAELQYLLHKGYGLHFYLENIKQQTTKE